MVSALDGSRVIAIVTGANSGFGYALCESLLSELSRPAPSRLPSVLSDPLSLPAPLRLKDVALPSEDTTPVSLTLVLAVRRRANGEDARVGLLEKHRQEIALRKAAQEDVIDGWLETLRIEVEEVELDHVGGETGVLRFCQRIRKTYPYVTSLYLNAGFGTLGLADAMRMFKTLFAAGLVYAMSHAGMFTPEQVGVRTVDGERGKVWSVNVLSTYILATELAPLLRTSPASLPIEPRVVYTTSLEAVPSVLPADVKDDPELLREPNSYRASKYLANLVMCQLDRTLNGLDGVSGQPSPAPAAAAKPEQPAREIRCLCAEPGIGLTAIAVRSRGVSRFKIVSDIRAFFNWLLFFIAYLVGSPHHPTDLSGNVLPMLYAALASSDRFLSAAKVPAPVAHTDARRFRPTGIRYGEVDEWERHLELGREVAERCEGIRKDWRRREGLD
ncbi:3-keto-steroid reductase [Cryptotrichosporon argae]